MTWVSVCGSGDSEHSFTVLTYQGLRPAAGSLPAGCFVWTFIMYGSCSVQKTVSKYRYYNCIDNHKQPTKVVWLQHSIKDLQLAFFFFKKKLKIEENCSKPVPCFGNYRHIKHDDGLKGAEVEDMVPGLKNWVWPMWQRTQGIEDCLSMKIHDADKLDKNWEFSDRPCWEKCYATEMQNVVERL